MPGGRGRDQCLGFARCSAFSLADRTQRGFSMVPVRSHLSKAMFPRMARSRRGRRILNFCLWLLGGVLIVGVVAGVLYILYQQGRM
jgi:hypothetical protein